MDVYSLIAAKVAIFSVLRKKFGRYFHFAVPLQRKKITTINFKQ